MLSYCCEPMPSLKVATLQSTALEHWEAQWGLDSDQGHQASEWVLVPVLVLLVVVVVVAPALPPVLVRT